MAQRLAAAVDYIKWISRDAIRQLYGEYSPIKELQVMRTIEAMTKGYLLDGKTVIVDANHVTIGDRAQVLQWGRDLVSFGATPATAILYYAESTNLDKCLRRNAKREQPIPEAFVRAQRDRLMTPMPAEAPVINIWNDTEPESVIHGLLACVR